jgi:chromate transporter
MSIQLSPSDWLALLTHFMALSLLAVGGAITTVPDMQRYLVGQQHWLNDSQFNASIALAQAAPGPNLLFVAVLGWQIGLNAGGGLNAGWVAWGYAALGVGLAMVGILLPSTTLTFAASRWAHQNRELRAVRAFKQGMAPVVVALLIATGWILTLGQGTELSHWPVWLLTAVAAVLVWRTRLHLLWLLGAGAVLGWFNWL